MTPPAGVTVLTHPLVQHKLTLLRRQDTATADFRQITRELSLLLAYEVTRDLPLETVPIETPLERDGGAATSRARSSASCRSCAPATASWTACWT